MASEKRITTLANRRLSTISNNTDPFLNVAVPIIIDDRTAPTQVIRQQQWKQLLVQIRHDPLDVRPTLITPGPDPQIVLRTAGYSQMNLRSGQTIRRYKPRAGDLFITSPSQEPYELERSRLSEQAVQTIHLYLSYHLLSYTVVQLLGIDPAGVELQYKSCFDDPLLRQLTFPLGQELDQPTASNNLFAETAAQLVAIQLIRQHCTVRYKIPEIRAKLPADRLRLLHDYILAHLEQSITLESLAAIACLSVYHFCRVFKQTTGFSPNQYVIEQRLSRARHLLRAGQPVALVALAVGYENPRYFARLFQRHVGCLPSHYQAFNH